MTYPMQWIKTCLLPTTSSTGSFVMEVQTYTDTGTTTWCRLREETLKGLRCTYVRLGF